MSEMHQSPRPPGPPPPPAVIWALALVMIAFEAAFELGEAGIFFPADLRFVVYYVGAFWDLYFEEMRAGRPVPIEFWTSFVTHAFLHGGLLHLVMNGVVLLGLGGMLANVLGTVRFLILFVVTAVAGALVFALITDINGPLVGASGAIFGFFGIFKRWEWRYIRAYNAPQRRFWGTIGGLVAINLILFFAFPGGGQLAWEAHLGGFVAGFLLGSVLGRRIAAPSPI